VLEALTPGTFFMFAVAGVLIYLAIVKEYEPSLLLPIGFGTLLGNLPHSPLKRTERPALHPQRLRREDGALPAADLHRHRALMDFRPLLSQPIFALMGAAGQLGIFATLILATALNFPLNQAASIAHHRRDRRPDEHLRLVAAGAGAARAHCGDGVLVHEPRPDHPAADHAAAHDEAERRIHMEYAPRPVARGAVIAFPIVVTVLVGLAVPQSAPLIATLMLGNLLKESGVVPRLSNSAANELTNMSTLFLGLVIGSLMQASTFLRVQTLFILALGLGAFVLDTVAGLLFGKMLAVVTRGKINPLVGAAGISAFPMSGRLVQKVAQEEDFTNHVLMHAMGANTAGQLGSVIAGGILLALVTQILGK
jgi:oxaloacetate decarboxylase beta subunit